MKLSWKKKCVHKFKLWIFLSVPLLGQSLGFRKNEELVYGKECIFFRSSPATLLLLACKELYAPSLHAAISQTDSGKMIRPIQSLFCNCLHACTHQKKCECCSFHKDDFFFQQDVFHSFNIFLCVHKIQKKIYAILSTHVICEPEENTNFFFWKKVDLSWKHPFTHKILASRIQSFFIIFLVAIKKKSLHLNA